MRELETWINDAASRLGLTLEKLPLEDAKQVTEAVKRRFVEGSPRVWWLGLRPPYVYYEADSMQLSQVLPRKRGNVYFIPESDDEHPLPVYMMEASNLELLIGECTFFEYYVADTETDWRVAETEHEVFIVCYASESSLRVAPGGQLWPSGK